MAASKQVESREAADFSRSYQRLRDADASIGFSVTGSTRSFRTVRSRHPGSSAPLAPAAATARLAKKRPSPSETSSSSNSTLPQRAARRQWSQSNPWTQERSSSANSPKCGGAITSNAKWAIGSSSRQRPEQSTRTISRTISCLAGRTRVLRNFAPKMFSIGSTRNAHLGTRCATSEIS